MNLLLFLNNDMHSAAALDLLLPGLERHVVKVILSQKVGGNFELSEGILELKEHEKCRFDWREKFGFEVESFDDVNAENALQNFRDFAPDLIISIRFGQIFKQALINVPRYGVINLHSGILPKYRGILATFWAILNGEKKIGMTLHYISDPSIDTGEIIEFFEDEIDWNSSLFSNINRLYEGGSALVLRALEKISRGEKISTISQKKLGDGGYFSYPKKADVERFLELMTLV